MQPPPPIPKPSSHQDSQAQPLPFNINIKVPSLASHSQHPLAGQSPSAACIAVKVAQTLIAFPIAQNRAINVNIDLSGPVNGSNNAHFHPQTYNQHPRINQPAPLLSPSALGPRAPILPDGPSRPVPIDARERLNQSLDTLNSSQRNELILRVQEAQRRRNLLLARQRQLHVERWRQAQAKAGLDGDTLRASTEQSPTTTTTGPDSEFSADLSVETWTGPITRSARKRAADSAQSVEAKIRKRE